MHVHVLINLYDNSQLLIKTSIIQTFPSYEYPLVPLPWDKYTPSYNYLLINFCLLTLTQLPWTQIPTVYLNEEQVPLPRKCFKTPGSRVRPAMAWLEPPSPRFGYETGHVTHLTVPLKRLSFCGS